MKEKGSLSSPRAVFGDFTVQSDHLGHSRAAIFTVVIACTNLEYLCWAVVNSIPLREGPSYGDGGWRWGCDEIPGVRSSVASSRVSFIWLSPSWARKSLPSIRLYRLNALAACHRAYPRTRQINRGVECRSSPDTATPRKTVDPARPATTAVPLGHSDPRFHQRPEFVW